MAVNLSPVGGVAAQFFTSTGAVLTGGKLYTYAAGTTTPATAYTSSNGATAWTNPIVLNAAGRVSGSGEIWITDGILYKFVLTDANDVLIATYDNISGINSNFISFTNQQQIVTATAGQTVFNLSISYAPGTNSLSVFVDGANQYGPGAQYAYTETDSDTVTFVSGLHVGAQVKFTTTQQQGAGAVDAQQVSYQPPFTGSVATNVEAKLAQTVSVKDFGAVGDGTTNDTAAIQAALNAGSTGVFIPSGNYLITNGLNIPDFVNVNCDVGVKITFNSTNFHAIAMGKGTNFVGNGLLIDCTNAAWNGGAILIDGVHRYADDYPASFSGINVKGVDATKGTGLYLKADNATNFISFVRFSNFTFYNLNFGTVLACGSSGNAGDVNTWHWINGNIFENFTFYGTSNGILLNGLTGVPAEIAGNIFNNFEFQIGTSTTKFPVYAYGASSNVFNNVYVWDWVYATSNPIVFAGGASSNQVTSNVDPVYVTTNGINVAAKNGAGSVSQLTSFGNVSIRDLSVLKIGYVGLEATIAGSDTLTITPRTGYGIQVASVFFPTTDNSFNLGGASKRWATVYAGTGTINTSDAREKQQINSLSDAEKAVALRLKGLLKAFKFNNAVEAKGDGARIHFGVMAQDVKEAFEAEGLDANNYALFCYDEWQDDEKLNIVAGNRYGIRYDELLAFVIGSL